MLSGQRAAAPTRAPRGEVLALMKQLAKAPAGVTVADLRRHIKIDASGGYTRLRQAADRGHLFRAHRAGYPLRWFDTRLRALAWELDTPVGQNAYTAVPARAAAATRLASAQAPLVAIGQAIKSMAPQPGQAPPKPSDRVLAKKSGPQALTRYTAGASKQVAPAPCEPVVAPDVPITRQRSYTHDPRYQVGPDEVFEGAGFRADWAAKRARPEGAAC